MKIKLPFTAKIKLDDLLMRRKQSLQEWILQIGFNCRSQVVTYCDAYCMEISNIKDVEDILLAIALEK